MDTNPKRLIRYISKKRNDASPSVSYCIRDKNDARVLPVSRPSSIKSRKYALHHSVIAVLSVRLAGDKG